MRSSESTLLCYDAVRPSGWQPLGVKSSHGKFRDGPRAAPLDEKPRVLVVDDEKFTATFSPTLGMEGYLVARLKMAPAPSRSCSARGTTWSSAT